MARPFLRRLMVVDSEIINLVFSEDIIMTDLAKSPSIYSISIVDGDYDVDVVEVLTSTPTASTISLRITPPQIHKRYSLTITYGALLSTDLREAYVNNVTWLHPTTKVDLAVSKVPSMFTTTHGSNLRALFQAIMISDNDIGGEFEATEFERPSAPPGEGNWGSSDWGGSDWGG